MTTCFVGSVYITEVTAALQAGQITRDQYDMLAVAINTGTNLPSVATPNGQACFPILADLSHRATASFVVRPYGYDGIAIYHRVDHRWFVSNLHWTC